MIYYQDCQALELDVEEKEEKFSKLEIEHKKSLMTIKGLRSYIRFVCNPLASSNFSLICCYSVPCHQWKKLKFCTES